MSFTKIASLYKAFRLQYNDNFVRRILDNAHKLSPNLGSDVAVDVGCGNGQLTAWLSRYFKRVFGMDVNDAQIEIAKRDNDLDNVQYSVGACEHLPFEDNSVDLITAAQCVHWFNHELFYPEVDRVLKHNGCFVVSEYAPVPPLFFKNDTISSELNRITEDFFNVFIHGDYLGDRPKRAILFRDQLFAEIPYKHRIRDRGFTITQPITVTKFCGLMQSKTYFQNYMSRNPDSRILAELRNDLVAVLQSVSKSDNPENLEMQAHYWCDILVLCKRKQGVA